VFAYLCVHVYVYVYLESITNVSVPMNIFT
jgi:hypothetical protein